MSKSIPLIIISLFIAFSYSIYTVLDNFYANETMKRIEQTLYFDKAIQEYVRKYQKPEINKIKAQDQKYKEFFNPILSSSTFISRRITKEYKELLKKSKYNNDNNIVFRVASDNPTNEINKANHFETRILSKFNKENLNSYSEDILIKDIKTRFLAVPVAKNTKKCLECHGDPKDAPKDMLNMYGDFNGFHEKEGKIRAMIAIYSPVEKDREHMMKLFFTIDGLAFVLLLLSMLLMTYANKKKLSQ